METFQKAFNKLWPWVMLLLIIYSIITTFQGKGTSRCHWVPELDDYECWDPR